jgi:hypothetical protein
MAAALDPGAVAQLLAEPATRRATLEELQACAQPIPSATALASAAALYALLARDTAEVPRDVCDRVGLLVARLVAEAPPGPERDAVYGAAWGDGRFAAFLNAPGNILAQVLRKPAAELTRADARSYACTLAINCPAWVRGNTAPLQAAGLTTSEYFGLVSLSSLSRALSARGLT